MSLVRAERGTSVGVTTGCVRNTYIVLDREQGRRNAMSCLVLCATQSSGRISVAVPVPESFTKHFLLVVVVLVAAAAFAVASI